jgi:DNA-binding HxlR family transcriptional regulator
MRRTSFADFHCSLSRSLERIGDWWTLLIVRDLYLGVNRFDDLVTNLGISRNLLAGRLVDLTEAGIVERSCYQQRPQRYEYRLTTAGNELIPVLMELTAWGDRWVTPENGPPLLFEHDPCKSIFTPQVTCSVCAQPVAVDNVTAHPGPGATAGPGTWLLGTRLPRRVEGAPRCGESP